MLRKGIEGDLEASEEFHSSVGRGHGGSRGHGGGGGGGHGRPHPTRGSYVKNTTRVSHAIPIVSPESRSSTTSCGTAPSPRRGLSVSRYATRAQPELANCNSTDQQTKNAAKNDPSQGVTAQVLGGKGLGGSLWAKSSDHTGSASPLKADYLDENGLLKGTVWGVDRGPVRDDNWILTWGCERLVVHCSAVAGKARDAHDEEASRTLYEVVHACQKLLQIKELEDPELFAEAKKALSTAQKKAWPHWVKFWQPAPPNAAADATARADAAAQGEAGRNVEMQDAPTAAIQQQSINLSQQVQIHQRGRNQAQPESQTHPQAAPAVSGATASAQAPHVTRGLQFGSTNQVVSDPISFQQQPRAMGFGQAPFRGFGAGNDQQFTSSVAQQAQPLQHQQPVALGDAFPFDLPDGFDDAEAKMVYEGFFFQDKRQ